MFLLVILLRLWDVVAQLWSEDRRRALQARWKKLWRVCLEGDSSDGCSEKVLWQKAQTFPPRGTVVWATTFEKSTARKLSVVNQRKNCQQRKTRRTGEEIPGINFNKSIQWKHTKRILLLLPDITDMLTPDRYLWSEYCLDATPERLSALTRRLNKSKKRNF